MKRLTCEMCGSTDLVKQDGVFVCQSCGCKYSIEEAKKMMIEGTVEVTGTVKVDNSATIANYIELAESALKGANGQSVLEYTNKALEVDPQNSRAWILLQNPRTSEVITAGKNAVQFAKAEEKESIEKQVYSYYLKYARTLLMVATNELNDNQRVRDVYKRLSSASLSNALTAANDCMKADSNNITVYENIANEGVNLVLSIPNDALERCSDLWEDVETCAEQYQRETNALDERFRIYTNGLTDSAKATRTLIKDQMTIKVKKAKEAVSVKQANERKARIEKYWGEHKSEWNMLTAKKESLQSNLDGLTDTLEKIPIRHGVDELMGEIEKKKLAKKNTGIFNLKEKKKLQEQIDALESVLQKKQEECREESESISKKVDEVMLLLEDVENELSKDRE